MRWIVLVAVMAGAAHASPMTITGGVTDVRSHWTADGTRIVTEATVRMDDGRTVVITQRDLAGIRENTYVRVVNGRVVLR